MTNEEATILKGTINASLLAIGANEIVTYDVFALWNQLSEKLYNVILLPKTYQAKFTAATDSQKLAFVRVSIKAQTTAPISYIAFNASFEEFKALDTELNNYLKP